MTYEAIVEQVKKTLALVEPDSVSEHIAVEVDIVGEGEGAFYIEAEPGRITVEPYEYFDRDIKITATADNLLDVVSGSMDIIDANLTGRITAEGDLTKAEVFKHFKRRKPAEKTAAKKGAGAAKTAKKTTAAKKPAAAKKTAK